MEPPNHHAPEPHRLALRPRGEAWRGDAIALAAIAIVLASLALAALRYPTFALVRAVAELIIATVHILYALAPVIALGAWLTARLSPRRERSLAEAWLSAWALGWTAITTLGLTLLATGTWHRVVWTLLAMLTNLALVGQAVRRSTEIRSWGGKLRDRLAKSSIGERRWTAIFVLVAAIGACCSLVPPNERDELTYHLLLPKLWDEQHHWWMETDNEHLFFPANAEIAWGYAETVGGSSLPRVVVLLFSLSALLLMWECARGERCSGTASAASVAFFAITPAALTVFAIAYVEWPLVFYVLLAWREIRRWLAHREPLDAALAAASLGAMAGLKASALPLAGLLAVEWIARAWKLDRRSAVTAALLSALGIAALAGPWMFRNATALGDPLHPLGAAVFGRVPAESTRDLVEFARPAGWFRRFPLLYHAVADPTVDHRLHLGWVLLVPVVMVMGWRRIAELPWVAALLYALSLFAFAPAPRIYLPALTLYWLYLPRTVARLWQRRPQRMALVTAGVTLALASLPSAVLPSLALTLRAAEGRFLAGGDRDSFLRTIGARTPVMDHVREHSPPDARVWVWCDDEVLYFDRWVRSDGPFAAPGFLRTLRVEGTRGLDRVLSSSRIDLVAVHHGYCPLEMVTVKSQSRSFALTPQEQGAIRQWLDSRLQPMVRDEHHALYSVRRGYPAEVEEPPRP